MKKRIIAVRLNENVTREQTEDVRGWPATAMGAGHDARVFGEESA